MAGAGHLTFSRRERPGFWEPKQALTFFELTNKIDVHLGPGPMTREIFLLICYHETHFSNIKQGRGTGPAVGFGQLQIFDLDKIPFFEWLGLNSVANNPNLSAQQKKDPKYRHLKRLPALTVGKVLASADFAVRMHCKYFEWLFTEAPSRTPGRKGVKSLDAQLRAQTGPGKNSKFVSIFRNAGPKLKRVIYSGDRQKVIDALNEVQMQFKKGTNTLVNQHVLLSRFRKYWDYTMPESEMVLGFRR